MTDLENRPDSSLVTRDPEEPLPDPGLPPHEPRPTDVDEGKERRAERQVAGMFLLSALFTVLFCVSYFVFKVGDDPTMIGGFGASNIALGLCLGMALLLIGVGAIQWARKLMGDEEISEMRHPARSSDEDREAAVSAIMEGTEQSGIARRPLIRNTLLLSTSLLGLPAIIALRDLGPLPGDKLYHTIWQRWMRVVQDVTGTPIKPEDLQVGQLVNAQPSVFFKPFNPKDSSGNDLTAAQARARGEEPVEVPEGVDLQDAKAKASTIVVRMEPDAITPSKGREDWGIDGILAYSKICTHVGCPISLWEQQTHHLLCPCHQSTFDLADNGKVIFGPAGRALPQLPLMLDPEGYLVAQSDYTEPVGPSFWERG